MKIKLLFPGLFQIKLPLPDNPLGYVNLYLVEDEGKIALIDVGFNSGCMFEGLCSQISEAGFNIKDLEKVFVTHFHLDHSGLLLKLRKLPNLKLILHIAQISVLKRRFLVGNDWKSSGKFFMENGFPKKLLLSIGLKFSLNPKNALAYKNLFNQLAHPYLTVEVETVKIGSFKFKILWTPGHAKEHICFYEAEKRFMIVGDHLLPTITSNISAFVRNENPLSDYLKSLRDIEFFDVKYVLPGHEEVFKGFKERVQQIKTHYLQRLNEVLDIVSRGKFTAYHIASEIKWNLPYSSWEKFPSLQKFLAMGETLAYLNFLKTMNLVEEVVEGSKFFYKAK
ncbi:MAG: MBL fold metallo-hydrolase [Candidatus Bathyarchaeota archaeon]|nr:MBL fold metallo-hydrolase [Candidatus Bathyarchaeota archaeon]